jgi:mono/diheme cytochrome c family protein
MVAVLSAAVAAQSTRPAGQAPARPAPQTRPAPKAGVPPQASPNGDPREATARRLCGVCHPFETITTIKRTRSQWEVTVENMIGRGARGTPEEFATVIDFLTAGFGLTASPVRGGAGPDDKPIVDPKAADLGRTFYAANCLACHGPDARGTPTGSNLVRSWNVLHDRYGSVVGPYLRASHPPVAGSATKFETITNTQVLVLAHFLREQINDTLRGAPMFKPGNVLTGDRAAGAAYFNGEGGCAKCHSPTGDFAGIGTRLEPLNIQQRLLFPAGGVRRGANAPVVTVTVTTEGGETLTGPLETMDDFNVSFRDTAGRYRTVRRAPGTRVVKNDPYAAHVELLPRITDKNIHDLVAYLESLK